MKKVSRLAAAAAIVAAGIFFAACSDGSGGSSGGSVQQETDRSAEEESETTAEERESVSEEESDRNGECEAPSSVEEQREFTVYLDGFDAAKRIPVINVIQELTGLGLGDAKVLVEKAPTVVKEGVSKAEADEMIKKIEAVNGKASKK